MVIITMDKLKLLKDVNIIDIRTPSAYNKNHLPEAVNYTYNNLIKNYSLYLDKEEVYYVYCTSGQMSKQLCKILNKKGYNLVAVIGGL